MARQLICIMGPTASGKSALAMALASHLPIEIISVDASQVYKGMDIGTAKPSELEKNSVPHHLIDILSPAEAYSASQFVNDAIGLSESLIKKGRMPCLVGGTMLYFKALQTGLSPMPKQDPAYRVELEKEAKAKGWDVLHRRLKEVDPVSAERIHPNDPQRIQRALEIYHLTGTPMTDIWASSRPRSSPFSFINIALMPENRAHLHQRIADRFDEMLALGLLEEVSRLKDLHLDSSLPSMRTVGYRQVFQYLQEEFDFDTMREKAIAATRQLAKRQITWLRRWPNVSYFSPEDPRLLDNVLMHLRRTLTNDDG